MVKRLKWGLADYVPQIYKFLSESTEHFDPAGCKGSSFSQRVYDPREIIGAWFFREFSSLNITNPSIYRYSIDDLIDSDVRSHEADLQVKIGKAAKNDRDWFKSRINKRNFLEIERRSSRMIDDAYSIPESSNPSIIMADMYNLRSNHEIKFMDYIGRTLNRLSDMNPRNYLEQMRMMHELLKKRS